MKLGSLSRQRLSVTKPLILVLLPALAGCSDPAFLFSGQALPFNFYEVDSGKAYRSAQPTGEELKNAINLLGLKTVLNLRGAHPGEDWYDQEADACRQGGVTLADYAMSAGSLPEPDLLKGIINTLKTAPYPILIHCSGGADRTSAVCAIYRMLIAGDTREQAADQLSFRFGHLRSQAPCMDALIEIYEPTDDWLDYYAQNYDNLTSTVCPE